MICPFRSVMVEAHLREYWVDPAAEAMALLWMFTNSNYPFTTNWFLAPCSWTPPISKRHRQQLNACKLRIKNLNQLKLRPNWLVSTFNRKSQNTKTYYEQNPLQTVSSQSSSSPYSFNWWAKDKNLCRLKPNGNAKKMPLPLRLLQWKTVNRVLSTSRRWRVLNSKLMMSFVSETSSATSAPHWALNWRRLTEKTKLMKYCGGR